MCIIVVSTKTSLDVNDQLSRVCKLWALFAMGKIQIIDHKFFILMTIKRLSILFCLFIVF